MHEHDPDLIMALAEGTLGESAASRAAADVAACDQCSADLAAQRSALEFLAGAPRVHLSAAESVRLHRAVSHELRLKTPARSGAPSRRRVRIGALAGAAAVLLAIVVAAPALNLLGSRNPDTGGAFNDALAPPTQAVAESDSELAPAISPAPQPGQQEPLDTAGAIDTVKQYATADLGADEEGLPSLRSDIDLKALRALFAAQGTELSAEALGEAGFVAPSRSSALPPEPVTPPGDGVTQAEAAGPTTGCDLSSVPGAPSGGTPVVLGLMDYQGTPALVVGYATPSPDASRIVVLAEETCEVLAMA